MCLGENKRFSAFGPGNSDERAGASSSLLTGIHELSICIKAMDDESCLLFVMHSLSFSITAGFMISIRFSIGCLVGKEGSAETVARQHVQHSGSTKAVAERGRKIRG